MERQPKLFSQKSLRVLAQYDATAEAIEFTAEDGPLDHEIRSFLVSVAAMLKRDCKIQDWKQDFPDLDDGYTRFSLFPKAWELPDVGPIACCLYWTNPFVEDAEDLCAYLRIPWNWTGSEGLRNLIWSSVPEGFTNVCDGEEDADIPIWRYIRFQDFSHDGTFDPAAFYQEILSAFQSLLSVRKIIDDYLSQNKEIAEARPARRQLGIVAVVDTETAGSEQELIELAVINAAFDRQTGEVFGILEEYEGLREPKCRISKADQRLNGLGINEVRGHSIDQARVKSMLTKAEFVVAHNATFDKARVTEQFKWAGSLDWRDSLNGVAWEDAAERNLPSLLLAHGVDCGQSHRAGCDARALLELLSYPLSTGKTYLAQLLTAEQSASTEVPATTT